MLTFVYLRASHERLRYRPINVSSDGDGIKQARLFPQQKVITKLLEDQSISRGDVQNWQGRTNYNQLLRKMPQDSEECASKKTFKNTALYIYKNCLQKNYRRVHV